MKKVVVLRLEFDEDRTKQKAMEAVSGISGIESITIDPKDKKMTVTGDIDLVAMVAKLKKICYAEIVSVRPAPEKRKEEPKEDDKMKKKDETKKDGPAGGAFQSLAKILSRGGFAHRGYDHFQSKQPGEFYYPHESALEDANITLRQLHKDMVDMARRPNLIADVSSITKEDTRYKAKANYYVGLEDELENLMKHVITEESDKLHIISITGVAGIGKTTMARRIFRDPRITEEFPILIWVSISQEFDMKNLCLTILKSFTSRDMSSKSVAELLIIVPKYLRMVKFFMVVHEVWEVQTWDQIKQVLPMENSKSRVLITTRISELAHSAAGIDRVHNLRFLNDKESWDLLRLEAFGRIDGCPVELEVEGKCIAHFCNGLPLSIVVVGGILVNKMSRVASDINAFKEEWECLLRMFFLVHRGIYDNSLEATRAVISLSYSALPDCFLYLGMLPEETEIPVWRLTHLWIQEGLIMKKQEESLEETAKDNLMELISMNLVIADKIDISGEVKTFHVHAVIHEFCKWTAYKRNFFSEIRMGDQGTFEPPISHLDRNRRLCIHSHVHNFLSEKPKIPNALSFLCLPKSPIILENEDVSNFTQAFHSVKVLEASSISFPTFPTELTLLVHLTYITLSCDELLILPEALADLGNLQTLVVDTLSPTLEVKADIWKLIHLQFLKTKASMFLTKWEGSGCENLKTLTRLSPQSFTSDVPNKAKNLKELGIRGMLSVSMNFEKLDYLVKLKLQHDVVEIPLADLPEQNSFPPNLRYLVLSGTFLHWKHISVLEKLGTLEVLKLKDNAFTGDFWEVADGSFRCLEALSIAQADLKYWSVSSNSFPKLKNMELKKCEKLLEVPLELGENLHKLSMSYVTMYAVTCAEKIEQARTANGAEFKLEIHHGDV